MLAAESKRLTWIPFSAGIRKMVVKTHGMAEFTRT